MIYKLKDAAVYLLIGAVFLVFIVLSFMSYFPLFYSMWYNTKEFFNWLF